MKTVLRLGNELALAGVLLVTGSVWAAEGLKVGDRAPDFRLQGSDGKEYKLSDYQGRQAVVVAWFPKAFTGGCTAECKSLREHSQALRAFDVAYFAASCDDVETNRRFAQSLDLDYPILCDPTRKAARAYGLVSSDQGNAARRTVYIGKDGTILHIDASVQTGRHGEDVAAQLKQLGVSRKK